MPFWKPYKVPRSQILQDKTKKNGFRHSIFTVKGDAYTGEWKNNEKHGKGVLLSKCTQQLYEGEWQNGKKSGYGVLSKILEDGSRALVVEGTWSKGKLEGKVSRHYTARSSDALYKGEMKRGIQHGFRRTRGWDCSEAYFEGDMKEGKRNGHGRMWYADGSYYEGTWKADLRDGIGLLVEVNGNRYEGEWRANKKHGYGQFYHLHSGQMQYGLWNHGIPICSVMEDIQFRQACKQPTPYPIPKIGLQDPDKLYEDEFDRITKEQKEESGPRVIITKPSRPETSLSPWFYDDCCNKDFPKRT